MVSSHTIDRPRCTDPPAARFWGSVGIVWLFESKAGFFFVGGWDSGLEIPPIAAGGGSVGMTVIWNRRDSKVAAAAGPCLICHPERAERAEGSPCWYRCYLGGKGLALFSKRHTMTKVSHHRAAGGRCIAAGRWYAEGATIARCPPSGSRGRGPWSGRGSQRVKPRLVSPFEKRRLFLKGQGFLRVVCPKARPCHPRQQRFRVGDPSNRRRWRLRRDDSHIRLSG